jgi:hypothetical protein
MGEKRNNYRRSQKEIGHQEDPDVEGLIVLKWILER